MTLCVWLGLQMDYYLDIAIDSNSKQIREEAHEHHAVPKMRRQTAAAARQRHAAILPKSAFC